MLKCRECGYEFEEGIFCPECGAPQVSQKELDQIKKENEYNKLVEEELNKVNELYKSYGNSVNEYVMMKQMTLQTKEANERVEEQEKDLIRHIKYLQSEAKAKAKFNTEIIGSAIFYLIVGILLIVFTGGLLFWLGLLAFFAAIFGVIGAIIDYFRDIVDVAKNADESKKELNEIFKIIKIENNRIVIK